MNRKKVYTVVLNYNGGLDTVDCIESLKLSSYSNNQIVVVDNASQRNGTEMIIDHLRSKGDRYTHINSSEIPNLIPSNNKTDTLNLDQDIILIQSDINNGYSAGNNIGIQYALMKADFEYMWIINNDTVVDKEAIETLVARAEQLKESGRKIGLIGTKVLYYDEPGVLQVAGGARYNKFTGVTDKVGESEVDSGQYDVEEIDFHHVYGASVFVSKEFIEQVGLMGEDYFMYYEEIDWAERGRKKGFSFSYSYRSRIWHKESRSIGGKRSKLHDYCSVRNILLIARKFHPQTLPVMFMYQIYRAVLPKIVRLQFSRLKITLTAFKDFLTGKKGKVVFR